MKVILIMYMNINLNLEDAVLLTIYKGINDPKLISKKLNVAYDDILVAISNLEAEELITRKKKGIIFKKEIYELTNRGFDKASKLKENLKDIASKLKQAYRDDLYHTYTYLIPLLIMFGFLDEIWFDDFDFDEINGIDMDSLDAGGGI